MISNAIPGMLAANLLPSHLPLEAMIRIELQEGVPIMRAATGLQRRIALLLNKQRDETLTEQEFVELERYAELDDYLSFINRLVRNQIISTAVVSAH